MNIEKTATQLISRELVPALWPQFEAYFEFKGSCSGCWCMNHRLPSGLDFVGEAAKLAMKQLVETKRVFGLLAFAPNDSIPVGWVAIDPKNNVPGHDCVIDISSEDSNVWSIHCLTSRSDWRGRGVETFLSKAAVDFCLSKGAKLIEAYPEPGSIPENGFKLGNSFSGYESDFLKLGFLPVNSDIAIQESIPFSKVTLKSIL
ncbi:MAG: hypothetical protein NT027_13660 [Proteobacteria bacterium]|nr:hypothetical protein [Pseudomonadota bacterium]